MPATPEQLKARWKTEDGRQRLVAVIEAAKKGEDWTPVLAGFAHVDEVENGRDLRYAEFWLADLEGDPQWSTDLQNAKLRNAKLRGADLGRANLGDADLNGAGLQGADLVGANLWRADLNGASLQGACLEYASLQQARLEEADLRGADFERADLLGANLSLVHFSGSTSFLFAELDQADYNIDPLLRRHILDERWLLRWREKNWLNRNVLYCLWLWTCDCGRSFWRWAGWSLGLALYFGFVFRLCRHSFVLSRTGESLANAHWVTPFYYSIVTFTTLGFGDVVPHQGDWVTQAYVTLEVILGYIMLGGLISIFATKLARRS